MYFFKNIYILLFYNYSNLHRILKIKPVVRIKTNR